ncbi:hypothetical protein DIPPA_30335 [Diplonema papillatum]|nr:hypothetical protein DIPPA_30335 [Diplonema papillatum]
MSADLPCCPASRQPTQVLIAANASLDLQDNYGQTALVHAAFWGSPAVHQLIESGSDIGLQDYKGRTASTHAVKNAPEPHHLEIVRKLAASAGWGNS